MGLSDTEATEETKSDWPPYCYAYDTGSKALYFNKDGGAVSKCNPISRVCVCRETGGVPLIYQAVKKDPVAILSYRCDRHICMEIKPKPIRGLRPPTLGIRGDS